MLKQKYFLTGIFILSAERQPIKLAWRKIVWLLKMVHKIIHLLLLFAYIENVDYFCRKLLYNMNIVYLIGNGFDINLGLNTRYCDFYKYYLESQQSDNSNPHIKALKKSLKTFLDQIPLLNTKDECAKWSDLEFALGEYTKDFKSVSEFQTIYYDLYDNLADYIEQESDKLVTFENVSQLYNDLISPENHLPSLDKNIIRDYGSKWNNTSQWNVNIITFNYTLTIEQLLGYQNKQLSLGKNRYGHPIILNSINHIHGTVNEHMLLGVNDILQIGNESFRDNQALQNILVKPQTNKMLKELIDVRCKKIIQEANLICLFGLSLGDTDSIWWKLIGEQLKKNNTMILYFAKGEEIPKRRFHLMGNKEIELKEYLLSKSELSIEEKKNIQDKIFIGYNTKIFSLSQKWD